MPITTVEEFYKEITTRFPEEISKEIGHFNVFRYEDFIAQLKIKPVMPYSRRAYYKISLITGRYKVEYADKVMDMENNTLLFATPKVPYHYIPKDENQSGYFCIFTDEFLIKNKSGIALDDLPIFKPGGYPVFQISEEESNELSVIYRKMHKELSSDYAYKYNLLRNYVQPKKTNIKVFELLPPGSDTPLNDKFKDTEGFNVKLLMAPKKIIDAAIKGLQKDQFEIFPGVVKIFNIMSRLAPKFLLSQTSKAGAKYMEG